MGEIIIKRNGANHLNLIERGKRTIISANQSREILSDDTVSLKVKSVEVLDIKVNDYFDVFDTTYRINEMPIITKINSRLYEYSIKGQGIMYDMLRCKFFNTDATGFKTDLDFPLIGNLELFLSVVKNNMHRFSDKWDFAIPTTSTATKTITFGSDTCLSALQKICNEFKTDFWVKTEPNKFMIYTGSFGNTIPITLEYGKGKGLYGLSRNNVSEDGIINRMYVSGGSDNLPNAYRNYSKNLKFSNDGYVEDAVLIADMGLKEGEMKFEEIYPHRTGKVTSLGNTKFKFIDNTMDFDLNEKEADNVTTKYLKPDTSAKIHFNTGNLAGYEFEIKKGGYKTTTKEFEIIPITMENGLKIPDINSTAFQFSVNDEYVLLDIYAPETYIANAEAELLAKANEQFLLKKQASVSYDLTVAEDFVQALPNNMDIGDYIRIIDAPLNIDKVIRINAITRDFIQNGEYNPNNYKLKIADTYEISYGSQMVFDIKGIKNTNTIINGGKINYSMLGLKNTRELQSMIFDTDGYFDPTNIKPNSIETNMLSVGSQSQQLSCSVTFNVNANQSFNEIENTDGIIYSQTFDKDWNISYDNLSFADNDAYYVYGKCSKTGTTGVIFYSKEKIKFDENPNDYYFLLGILHSVVDETRVLSLTFGTTTINGGLIRTGIISSVDGQTYINLDTGEIKGKIEFTADSPAAQITNFLKTTIDGGVISTGTMQVGGENGANAFISGVIDKGSESIRFGAGKPYAQKQLSPFQVLDNGLVRFVNPSNGKKAFELGYRQDVGKVVFDIYDNSEVKIATIGSQGIVFANYIPYSWTTYNGHKLTVTNIMDQNAIKNYIKTKVQAYLVDGIIKLKVSPNKTYYRYLAGLSMDSNNYVQFEKYYYDNDEGGNHAHANTTKLANGLYFEAIPELDPTSYDSLWIYYDFWVVVFEVANGEMANNSLINIQGQTPNLF